MITINSIGGNINQDRTLFQKYQQMKDSGLAEIVKMSRMEAQKVRMRKNSSKGTDVALLLPPSTQIRHGDVLLLADDRMIIVEIEPEKVAVISLKEDVASHHLFEIAVKIGHTVGNLHRPIKSEDHRIFLPIQAESELDLLNKLFGSIRDHVDITTTSIVFEPDEGDHTHEH